MGIDPGKLGGIVLLSTTLGLDNIVIGMHRLSNVTSSIFKELLKNYEVQHIYLEKAHAMPKQGVASMFNYGQGFGRLVGWIEMCSTPYTLVPPPQWTKVIHGGCSGTAKNKTLQAVKRLFPNINLIPEGCRTPHSGIVDALAIAEYGRRVFR